jgi:AraC family transcriptional regulator
MSQTFRHCIDAHLVREDGGRLPLAAPPDWGGLPMALGVIPGEEQLRDIWNPVPTLLVARSGSGRRWYRRGLVTRELATRPRMIEIYPGDFQLDGARWEGVAGHCIGVQFSADALRVLMHDDAPVLALPAVHELHDERIVSLVEALADEIAGGGTNGRLYAQGLSLALVGRLQTHYAFGPAPTRTRGRKLAAQHAARIREFIDANLGRELGVSELAAVVGLSSAYFVRIFAATFGRTPHRYVLERRIQVAVRLLSERERPIAEIAYTLGFSSQAHFTAVFRRQTGHTPGRSRSA